MQHGGVRVKKLLRLLPAILFVTPALAAPAQTIDTGNTTWLLVSSALVMLMTPGLAFFYAGMVHRKNVVSTLLQNYVALALVGMIWVIVGYSLVFSEHNAFIGGFDFVMLKGIASQMYGDTGIPLMAFMAFQMMFAIITPALITGAFAERVNFKAWLFIMMVWSLAVYLPVAHWVWGPGGWIAAKGGLDFAGGLVVHITAGISGLASGLLFGRRADRGPIRPNDVTLIMLGAALLWFGWFGFNAGSSLEANGTAALAFANTWIAPAAAALSWTFAEWAMKGRPSLLGAVSGAVAGLVAITPAAGFVGVGGALIIGLLSGVAGLWGVHGLKRLLGADDSLDVFGLHGVCGILGAVLTGVFASPDLGGTGVWDYVTNQVAEGYSILAQVKVQVIGVGVTVVWTALVSAVAYKLVDLLIGLRVKEDAEREGLDVTSHGEKAYSH